MDLRERFDQMGKQLLALVLITAVLAVGGIVVGIGDIGDGEAYSYTRIALGLLGLVGAALIVLGKDYGKTGLYVVIVWAAIQCVYYADVPDGNYTRQLIDGLLGATSEQRVNDEITSYSAVGINLTGLIMLIFAYATRNHATYWQNRATRNFSV